MRVDDLEATDVACVDPSKAISSKNSCVSTTVTLGLRVKYRQYSGSLNQEGTDSPFSGNALEIAPLIPIFCLNLMRINRARDIILLDHNAIEIHKRLRDHV